MKILVCDENKVVPVRKMPRLKHSMRMGSGMSSPAIRLFLFSIIDYRISIDQITIKTQP